MRIRELDGDEGANLGPRPAAPAAPTYRFIPEDANPNRLLEVWPPREALERVTDDHRKMADWIRQQPWDHARPTKEQWRYIGASRRLKACRNLLRDFVKDLDSLAANVYFPEGGGTVIHGAADEMVRLPRKLSDMELAEEARREAEILGMTEGQDEGR